MTAVEGFQILWFFDPVRGQLAGLELESGGFPLEIQFPDGAPVADRPGGAILFRRRPGEWERIQLGRLEALPPAEEAR